MIVVVGGGITGLATGFELEKAGVEYTVLEATARPGGVVRSGVVEGRVLDWGPQRIRLTGRIRGLVDALDLASELVAAPEEPDLYIYRDGRLRRLPFSAAGLATSDVLSVRGRLRVLCEPLTAHARPDERVADFFSRKLGREMYETVAGPLYGGLYAADPEEMEVGLSLGPLMRDLGVGRSLLVRLLRRGGRIRRPRVGTFRDGMQALPDALARRLGRRFRSDAPVRSITPAAGQPAAGGEWRVALDGGEAIDAAEVVLATPAAVTARLLEEISPDAAAAIGGLRHNPLAVVHLEADTELRGLGFKVSYGERDLSLTGVTFNDSLFGRRHLYTAYLGGARNPQVAAMDDDEVGRSAVRDFKTTTGYDARVLAVSRGRMPAWDLTWRGLKELELPPGLHPAGSWWSRPGLPGRLAEAASLAGKLAPAADSVAPHVLTAG